MKIFSAFSITIIATVILFSCKKEYSYEGGPSTTINSDSAIYVLSGFPNACSNTKVLGNYFAGVKLSSSNSITLMVNVSKIGNYSISTSTVNGMSFTGSGKFTQTGLQEISLLASGTPLQKAVNNILVTAGNSYCNFTIIVNQDTPAVMSLDTWEFTHDSKTFNGFFDGALSTILNGYTVLTLVGLTPTKDTAITILVDIAGSAVVKTGNYSSLSTATFSFFTSMGKVIYMADKTSRNVEISVVVANFDPLTQIIEGSFSGTASNEGNQSVPITKGKFRAKLNR